jgi:hypothetical protein
MQNRIGQLAQQSSHGSTESSEFAIVGNRVELQLLTTLECNLKCSYANSVFLTISAGSGSATAPAAGNNQ